MPVKKRLIKKYPNRRLYDTQTSAYITVVDVKRLIIEQEDIQVLDAKTDEDLTRSVLLQILLEEEAGGAPILSEVMLAQMIRFYGHAMQGVMGNYLEKNLQAFVDIQSRFHDQTKSVFDAKGLPLNAVPSGLPTQEQWSQLMSNMQAPMVQGFMNNYVEQSKTLFTQMQEQMQTQAKTMWPGFVVPGTGPADEKSENKKGSK